MKVTQIRSFPVRDVDGRLYFIVRVDTDAGIYGLGEVGVARLGRSIAIAIEHLAEIVIGSDPWETERLWQQMFRGLFFPAERVYACAISGIDIALWDIKAKSVGMPLYKILGGPTREKVACYPHVSGETTQEIVDDALKHVDEGWKFVRTGQPTTTPLVGQYGGPQPATAELDPIKSISMAVEQFSAIRDAVGPDIQICTDLHTRLDPTHSIALCRQLEEFKPFFVEDAVRSENPASYRNIRRQTRVPLAAGEHWWSKWPFREVIEDESIDYCRIDLCIVGGITETLKITNWAETHYIDIVPHNPLGPVSAAACVSLCMASTNVGVQEMPRQPGTTDTDLFPIQIGWEDGFAFCNDAPGLGIEMNMDVAEARAGDPHGWTPQLRRNDGAFTNW
jgi:galactonate dehydratase